MPASVSDEELAQVARFRKGGRLPALCWKHVHNGGPAAPCARAPAVRAPAVRAPAVRARAAWRLQLQALARAGAVLE